MCQMLPMRNEDDTSRTLRRQLKLPAGSPPFERSENTPWRQGCSSGIYRFERVYDLANRRDPTVESRTFTALGEEPPQPPPVDDDFMKGRDPKTG